MLNTKKELSLAPMVDVTTPHFRKLIRLANSHPVILFTEMIVDKSVIYMEEKALHQKIGPYDPLTIIQLGGSEPQEVVQAVERIISLTSFRMFNLNCGCPSIKVRNGNFGAVLMKYPEKISEIINRVYKHTGIILSIKCRIGIDEYDSYEYFENFIGHIVAETPCMIFYIHARKCLLNGISTSQNRTVPPLDYSFVYRAKAKYPHVRFILNGNLGDKSDLIHLEGLDGMMIGRKAIENIFIFDEMLGLPKPESTYSVVKKYLDGYSPDLQLKFFHLNPIMNLLKGKKGCKNFKKELNSIVRDKLLLKDARDRILKYF
ncbi:tRNA-dihydrouridine(20/20a) synthase [Astathelohania contejeani]|uniref:tRNA-dihydrouridine synthase n=1 Tax=Astathelohania contejeani TaxID=164912 RepID=A0ABQ7HXV0_9MICR|nr:tRNA-dihydrouridine(20/20a) synthase [Thelohania contejeani]